jgi:hypothetical protein
VNASGAALSDDPAARDRHNPLRSFDFLLATAGSIPAARFAELGLEERRDLQWLIRERIDVVAPDTLVLAEEFGNWKDSRRRIDLLALDREANLVVSS